ncbi:CDP-diacylglycerol--glycerol-3-phosphate 3-phosphatidyltransferase [Helicobacter cetorum]|uniref:CDP-diacylglycerol--glycerol-3-phosphate 3-phosphatidyltransferase n=1 Tax=Helicobacter cetorum (strain ATCC BAA-540 / CCUG 52418 / MIT 99-5656) TaxID=1163745 RepID=I0ETE3_HELCM|nr:CDP-diacylglycerol--glycerol-3-phosphate 3-phosphatidyltransferase [Helicobacter cetorum]AFI06212.1 phosphatidylglycerophosphate synthase [Helicobacter cetorum MIT 99-5656]
MKFLKLLPNSLTILRIILALFLLFLLLNTHTYFNHLSFFEINMLSSCVFLFAAFTDLLDGYIARNYQAKSRFGEIFDPLADKMLILSAFLGLVHLGRVDAWIPFIILGREFFISGLRVLAANEKKDIPVSKLGKYKTALQVLAISSLLANLAYAHVFVAVAVFATIYSGLDYTIKYYKS